MPEEVEPLPVRLKYYTSLTLGLVSCISCFIFMFLVPFVLDPSISTLVADFDPEPVVCRTIMTLERSGSKNCSWSSCKHGCTTDQYECKRIYVNYLMKPFAEHDGTEYEADEDVWAVKAVPVFINIKACGYPPTVNCSVFSDNYAAVGSYFPCYYSRTDPSLVITEYSWGEAVQSLIIALIVPNVLTAISLGILSYWWYPGCRRRGCQYQVPPDQEAAITCDGESSDENADSEDEDEEEEEEEEGDDERDSPDEIYVDENKETGRDTESQSSNHQLGDEEISGSTELKVTDNPVLRATVEV